MAARVSIAAPDPAAPPDAAPDAGLRNMALLVQLRWLAVGGQLATILVVHGPMGIRLPLAPLIGTLLLLVAINLISLPALRRRQSVSEPALLAALLFDVGALTWQLHFTGGLANPFVWLFLLQVVIGAVLLPSGASWAVVGASLFALFVLAVDPVPLELPPPYDAQPLALYLQGSIVSFILIVILLVAFVTRIARNLKERDAALAAIRQRAAEEDHIIRMGLLASGAAHELGTPLATLSVLVNDWRTLPEVQDQPALADDIEDMEAAIRRCKTIVSGILMSAGEARGEATERTTLRAFLAGIVAEWQGVRGLRRLELTDDLVTDLPILSDPALRQVIGTAIDNAAEVSPDWVGLHATLAGRALVLSVTDRGPGFPADLLDGFGRPYRSTKDRPGAGLGLFLLVNVVRKLGGTAAGTNLPEGGARVTIRLPLAALTVPERAGA